MKRSEQRAWLMKIAYQTQLDLDESDSIEQILIAHELDGKLPYIQESLESMLANKDEIDRLIEKNLTNWTLPRLLRIDLAILRVAVNEMCFTKLAPTGVVINESVELAKEYSDENSYRFINGVLSSISQLQDQGNENFVESENRVNDEKDGQQ